MAILGLILLAAAAVLGGEIAVSNRATVGGEAFDYSVASATPMAFLLVGALLALVAMMGLLLLTGGLARRRRRHAASREYVHEAKQTTEAMREENERLRAELLAERRQQATLGGVAVPPGVGDVPYGDQIGDAVRSTTISDTGHYDPYPAEDAGAAPVVSPERSSAARGAGARRRSGG